MFQTDFSTKPNPPSSLCWSNNLDHPQATTLVAFQLANGIEKKEAKGASFLSVTGWSPKGIDHWNGPLEWTTGIDTRTCSIVATKACERSEAALNWKFSVAHVTMFLKFNTYMNIQVHVIDLLGVHIIW